jgi:polar amino acid transport system substrate-binding protein
MARNAMNLAAYPHIALKYAPHGRLRFALNFGNPVLARRDDAGRPAGVTIDLATELALMLGIEFEFVSFTRAADVVAAAEQDVWDVAFLAVDQERRRSIAFTTPYVCISGCYLITPGAVDYSGPEGVADAALRIGVVEGSAYALFLSRQRGAEHLVVYPTFTHALAAFDAGEVDGLGGIEEVMRQEAERRPGSTVLQPPFMQIRQAVGLPIARRELLPDLEARLVQVVQSGGMKKILERHHLTEASAS